MHERSDSSAQRPARLAHRGGRGHALHWQRWLRNSAPTHHSPGTPRLHTQPCQTKHLRGLRRRRRLARVARGRRRGGRGVRGGLPHGGRARAVQLGQRGPLVRAHGLRAAARHLQVPARGGAARSAARPAGMPPGLRATHLRRCLPVLCGRPVMPQPSKQWNTPRHPSAWPDIITCAVPCKRPGRFPAGHPPDGLACHSTSARAASAGALAALRAGQRIVGNRLATLPARSPTNDMDACRASERAGGRTRCARGR